MSVQYWRETPEVVLPHSLAILEKTVATVLRVAVLMACALAMALLQMFREKLTWKT